MIVEVAPVVSCPRPADGNIATNAEENDGVYRPSRHLERIRDSFERQGKDSEAFVRSHVRRLEAPRRAGHVERIDADHCKIPTHCRTRAGLLAQGGYQNTDAVRAFCRELAAFGSVKRLGSTNFADMLSGGQMRDVVLEAMAAKASPQAHRIVLFGRCEGNSSPPSHSAHLGAVRSR